AIAAGAIYPGSVGINATGAAGSPAGAPAVRWQQFNLYVSILPYIEQGTQLNGQQGFQTVAALNTTVVPADGQSVGPPNTVPGAVKSFLCPSRRTTVVGPKTDYA